MRHGRSVRGWGIGVLVAAGVACETTRNPGGIQRDVTSPTIVLSQTAGDTQDIASGLRFGIAAVDNLALKTIRLIFSGGYLAQEETTFVGTVKNFTQSKTVTFPAGSGAGGNIQIVGRAIDGGGNFSEDTISVFLSNVQALVVLLNSPTAGAVASSGRSIPVQVTAFQTSGIQKIGFLVAPANAVSNPTRPPNDSLVFTIPYADSVVFTDTLDVVATTGTFSVVGFAEDSAGRRGTSNVVTVSVQSALNDTTKPQVTHTVNARVEVDDSVTVRATDPSAISWLGLEIRRTNGTLLRFDSVAVGSNLTDVSRKFSLNLGSLIPPDSMPYSVVVRGYGCDAATARNCAFSQTSTVIGSPVGPARIGTPQRAPGTDTVIVVAGTTVPLPAGGRIADAIFNVNRNELYLTNTPLSRVEVFQVANTTFVAGGIPTTGPFPWGIALWPRDTLGNYRDTIVVANSGGTQLAIINVGPGGPRQLLWRQDLPDFQIQTYKVVSAGGVFQVEILEFNVSDRPQYVGTVCRPAGGTACAPDSVFAIYSTTPTASSPSPFNGRATLRMEKLTPSRNPAELFGHLFWEIATEGPGLNNDTLRVVLRRGFPYNQSLVVLSACAGQNVDLARMGLGDSTYVRNSGNFTHALVGEGGNIAVAFARAMAYTAKAPLLHGPATFSSCFTSPDTVNGPIDAGENHQDFGISPGVEVRDFIANTGIKVASIATNFNGATNAVRADSVYYLDAGLRLKATSPAPTGAPGMDMNYFHAFEPSGLCPPASPACGGTGSPNDRILFAARPDANIDVFDTFFGNRLGSIPIRDPIIGPLRVARDATGQLLFGVTASGLVMLRLPAFTNPLPVPRPGGD